MQLAAWTCPTATQGTPDAPSTVATRTAARLNDRFASGRPSPQLADAGVIIHQFDGFTDCFKPRTQEQPWLFCRDCTNEPPTFCQRSSSHVSATLVSASMQPDRSGTMPLFDPELAGFVLSPTAATLMCSYPFDGRSHLEFCAPNEDASASTCVPGCSLDPASRRPSGAAGPMMYYAWPPHALQELLEWSAALRATLTGNETFEELHAWGVKHDVRPPSIVKGRFYNELVLAPIWERMPDALDAVFYIGGDEACRSHITLSTYRANNGSVVRIPFSAPLPYCESYARWVHGQLLRHFPEAAIPLLRLNVSNLVAPFSPADPPTNEPTRVDLPPDPMVPHQPPRDARTGRVRCLSPQCHRIERHEKRAFSEDPASAENAANLGSDSGAMECTPSSATGCGGKADCVACTAMLRGTSVTSEAQVRARDDADETSSRSDLVFNVGAFKTGSTALTYALQTMGITPTCKTAWGSQGIGDEASAFRAGQIGSDPDLARTLQRESWELEAVADFIASPLRSNTSLTRAVTDAGLCRTHGDAPWVYLYPTLMRAFPKAKFILTRLPSCADWVVKAAELQHSQHIAAGGTPSSIDTDRPARFEGLTLQSCFYGLGCGPDYPLNSTLQLWHRRCVEHERSVRLTARALDVALLELDVSMHDSQKSDVLQRFLAPPVPKYRHVSTGGATRYRAKWLEEAAQELRKSLVPSKET
tara:strand:+ start:125 stop:2233 length:2109 start_codon:yes stop_codon:yes gene_type:complete